MAKRKISESTFTIVANGFADGPAQALRDYLIAHKAKRVTTIAHPLVPEGANTHVITKYAHGNIVTKSKPMPHKPPYTYLFDPFIPMRLERSSAWFGFNNLASYRGLVERNMGRTDRVIYWAVDFVADRFGNGHPATWLYNKVDRIVATKADARVELSKVGVTSRNTYLKIKKNEIAPTFVVPMGAWLDRTPKVTIDAWKNHRIVYLGHLVERQGVSTLIEAVSILTKKGIKVTADIIGTGPEEEKLKAQAQALKIDKLITFHGFVKDHKEVEHILASGTLAVAPYVKDEVNFVQFTDAGKLKAYLGAYLPIVLNDVPNNAHELSQAGAAIISHDSAIGFADALSVWLTDQKSWQNAHKAAVKVAKEFDWENLLKKALFSIGFDD